MKYIKIFSLVGLMFGFFACYGMEPAPERRLVVYNNSRWNIIVGTNRIDSFQYHTFRDVPSQIILEPYGDTWRSFAMKAGWDGQPVEVNITRLMAQKNLQFDRNTPQDLLLTINIPAAYWSPTYDLRLQSREVTREQKALELPEAGKSVWRVFPSLMSHYSKQIRYYSVRTYVDFLNGSYPNDLARYVLGLPANPTRGQILQAYKNASLLWHPDKWSNDPRATMIFQIIGRAQDILKGEAQNFDGLITLQIKTLQVKQ